MFSVNVLNSLLHGLCEPDFGNAGVIVREALNTDIAEGGVILGGYACVYPVSHTGRTEDDLSGSDGATNDGWRLRRN